MAVLRFLLDLMIFIVTALPLHFAVKILGGKTTLLKTLVVSLISGLIVTGIKSQFAWFGGFLAFLVSVWLYHEIFRLRWIKAFFVWLVQLVVLAIFFALAAVLSLGLIFL